MSKKRAKPHRVKMSVFCSPEQSTALDRAAASAGVDKGSYLLAHGLRAAGTDGGALALPTDAAQRLAALAARQGVDPVTLVDQLVVGAS